MAEQTSYCGGTCQGCAIYLATRLDDEHKRLEMRTEIARQIETIYGHHCHPEDIADCDGCKATSGRFFNTDCAIRNCARQKNLESCTSCRDYPCDQLKELSSAEEKAME